MQSVNQDFTTRQYMVTPDYEYFHYKDESTMEIEYHNHDFYEIYLLVSGKVNYLIEGKSYRLKPGDIILINNNELHKPVLEFGGKYERLVIWVNPDFIKKQGTEGTNLCMCFEASSKKKYNLIRPNAEILQSIKNIISKFEKACSNTGFGSDILKNTYLTELMVFLNRSYLDTFEEEIEIDIEHNEKVSSLIMYINEKLAEDLSLDTLSTKFYLSKYHLLREFKKHAGYSIHQYIQKKRMIMAKSMLREGLTVSEVFLRCGFGDYSNFIRSFKKIYGQSPKKYTKSHGKLQGGSLWVRETLY